MLFDALDIYETYRDAGTPSKPDGSNDKQDCGRGSMLLPVPAGATLAQKSLPLAGDLPLSQKCADTSRDQPRGESPIA